MKNTEFGFALFGGPEGIRTHDLTDANRTLSQLSYVPIQIKYSTLHMQVQYKI